MDYFNFANVSYDYSYSLQLKIIKSNLHFVDNKTDFLISSPYL